MSTSGLSKLMDITPKNIEAFNAMFEEIIESIDIEDIENCMQHRKDSETINPSLIPPNTPKSHWWWWI